MARVLDARYHQENANVARITGITTTSMIAVELIRSSRSAAAIGPCGSRTPWEQAPSVRVATRTSASTAYRMSDLVRSGVDGAARGAESAVAGGEKRREQQEHEFPGQAHLDAPANATICLGALILAPQEFEKRQSELAQMCASYAGRP